MIALDGVSVVYAKGTPLEKKALVGVDLRVEDGQFVTVIGSNGAGKSTLLGALTGDVPIQGGRVVISNEDVTRQSPAKRARLVARVFQDPLAGSCANLSVEENLAVAYMRGRPRGLGPSLTSARRAEFRDRIAPLGLGLENRMGDLMGLLSGGQRQAVALVMATLAPSRILLLDEHTAALDPGMAEFVIDLTRRVVAERRLTTLMVTHSMRQALDCGTRTIMLHEGEVILDVRGDERAGLGVDDLVAKFRRARGQDISDDELLIT